MSFTALFTAHFFSQVVNGEHTGLVTYMCVIHVRVHTGESSPKVTILTYELVHFCLVSCYV